MLGQYDVVMACGVFFDGHIPAAGFDDAHAICKPQGHFITSFRAKYFVNGEEHGYKDKLDELITAAKFRLVKTWSYMRGVKNQPGSIFNEVECTMFICQRIDAVWLKLT